MPEGFWDSCVNILVKQGNSSNHFLEEDEYLSAVKEEKKHISIKPIHKLLSSALRAWLAPLILRKKESIIRLGLVLRPENGKTKGNWFLEPIVFFEDKRAVNLKKFWEGAEDKAKKEIIDLIYIMTRYVPVDPLLSLKDLLQFEWQVSLGDIT